MRRVAPPLLAQPRQDGGGRNGEFSLTSWSVTTPVDPVTIRHFETVRVEATKEGAVGGTAESPQLLTMSFDALGRRFELVLEPIELLPPGAQIVLIDENGEREGRSPGMFYRGQVAGEPSSWARVTVLDGKMEGMIRTVDDVLFFEPAHRFDSGASDDAVMVYRLSDVESIEPLHCGVDDRDVVGAALDAYRALVERMAQMGGTPVTGSAAGGTFRRIELAATGDYEFHLLQQARGVDPLGRIMSLLNNVDGIYRAEAGVAIEVTSLTVYQTANDPFDTPGAGCTNHSSLLGEFSDTRESGLYPWSWPQTDLAHLFTGRDLCGSVIGVAWRPGVCRDFRGTGLSQDFTSSLSVTTVLVAHELGHSCNAIHDTGSCAGNPPYIMQSSIGGSNQPHFSSNAGCSVDQITSHVAPGSASCLDTVSDGTPTPTASHTLTPLPPTHTVTATPTPTPTPIPVGLSGSIRHYSTNLPVPDVTVHLRGTGSFSTSTDIAGDFAFTDLDPGNWEVEPEKIEDVATGIDSMDASYVLQVTVGSRSFDALQTLAGDVTGDGSISVLDAARILQFAAGTIDRFPVADTCGSDWAFVPMVDPAANQTMIPPQVTTGECQ